MNGLKRNDYRAAVMQQAVAQIVLNWDQASLAKFCDAVRQEAFEAFQGVQKNSQQSFQFHIAGAGIDPTVVKQPIDGLEISTDKDGSKIIIDPTGYRVHLSGLYKGRHYLFELVEWVRSRIIALEPEVQATRVSVLYESRMVPRPTGMGFYRIEDYFVPRFELADERLDVFPSFMHTVYIDMAKLRPGPYRCRLELSGNVKGPGLNVLIDVLDDMTNGLDSVLERLTVVKDLESHVFESTITDEGRKLYGIIK